MTDTRARAARRNGSGYAAADPALDASASGRGFTPTARRRNRIALGVVLAAIAIGGNALVYAGLNDDRPVVQVVVDVPAGAEITADMLRTVGVDADTTVNLVAGDELDGLVGRYAKVRMVSGSLVTAESFQSAPLVAEGSAVVAIQVAVGTLPIGLRERVPVLLVIPANRTNAEPSPPISITGRVVGLPVATTSALGVESLSVEVAATDAPVVAAADDVRLVLLEPSADPASEEATVEEPATETATADDGEGES